jgi:Tol biopolymer transport system component
LFLLSTDTLVTRRLTAPTDGSGDLRFAFSPDGESLAVIRWGRGIGIHLLSVATGATTTLLSGQEEWIGGVAWSADGRSLILSANRQGVRHLWRLPVAGGELEQLAVAGDNAYYPSVSLRGDRLAFVHELRDWDLAQVSLGGAQAARASSPVARSPRIDLDPAFSPDGGMLAFVSERGGTREVWVSGADGSGARQLTSFPARGAGNPSWSPDGRFIAFHARGIKVVSVDGGPARVVSEDGEMPSWSADGRWIYFRRNLEGRVEIWRVPADGGSAVRAIDSEAMAAREDPGGTNLYFVRVGGGLWRRPVRGGDEVPVIPGFKWSLIGYWDVAHGGVYYVDGTPNTDQAAANSLRFFDFARRRAIDVGYLPGFIEDWVGGLTVSANRRSVVYSHRTYKSSEVRVVEHFR